MYVKLICYNSADWPNENNGEIDRATKKCLEVFLVFQFKNIFSHKRKALNKFEPLSIDVI